MKIMDQQRKWYSREDFEIKTTFLGREAYMNIDVSVTGPLPTFGGFDDENYENPGLIVQFNNIWGEGFDLHDEEADKAVSGEDYERILKEVEEKLEDETVAYLERKDEYR